MNSRVLHVTGMTCDSCANHVEKALLTVPGVHKAEVSYPDALARVSGEPALDPDDARLGSRSSWLPGRARRCAARRDGKRVARQDARSGWAVATRRAAMGVVCISLSSAAAVPRWRRR